MKNMLAILVLLGLGNECSLLASGGYDHGTSTGRGKFEVDLTWNPFNIIKFGQSYVVIGYGITERLDLHGYYAFHPEKFQTYYFGLFFQFLDLKYLDLATAIGSRTNRETGSKNLFFPQILYNIKLTKVYTVGGSVVTIRGVRTFRDKPARSAFDIAFFIPIDRFITLPGFIDELKLGLGAFNPVTNLKVKPGQFLPTYSVDIKFSWKKGSSQK